MLVIGVTSIEVEKGSADLFKRLRQAEAPTAKERLQVLYQLKQDNAPSISVIIEAVEKHRWTFLKKMPSLSNSWRGDVKRTTLNVAMRKTL